MFKGYTEEEIRKWVLLRSIEWTKWPYFISQIIAPILLYYWPWQGVVLLFVLAQILWQSIRYKYVGIKALSVAATVINLKLLICPLFGYLIYSQGRLVESILALFWPLFINILSLFLTVIRVQKPPMIGIVENLMVNKLFKQ